MVVMFVFVLDKFNTNTIQFSQIFPTIGKIYTSQCMYPLCENSFHGFFPTIGKNLVLSQAIYLLPTCSVRNVWRILRRIEMFIMSRT